MFKASIFFLLLSFVSCSTNQNKKPDEITYPIEPLKISPEGWGGDITLSVTNISENDSGKIYKAISTYENNNVGLQIFIHKTKEGNGGFGNGVVIKSLGKESDNLLQTLAILYKQKTDSSWKFTDSISADFVNLKEFAGSTGKKGEPYTIGGDYKLFLHDKSGENDAELYLNIDSSGHRIQLSEKDEEYRPALIQLLKK